MGFNRQLKYYSKQRLLKNTIFKKNILIKKLETTEKDKQKISEKISRYESIIEKLKKALEKEE